MSELVSKYTINFDVNVGGRTINKKVVFGTGRKLFDKNKLIEAFDHVKKIFKDELGGMSLYTIKRLTWDQYERIDPLGYYNLKDDDEVGPSDEITKDNITIVNPHIVSGSSALVLAGSMSGKTTLLVQAIKNILRDHRKRYDMIIIFSESIAAMPLKNLPINDKIYILPMFIPELVRFLMKVNQATDLRYSILIILDDVSNLKSEAITKLLLIARNSGISTIISTQQIKGVTPSCRASVHNVYILGSRNSEDREKLLKMYLRAYLRDKGMKSLEEQENWLRDNTYMGPHDRKLIRINMTEDRMTVHTIKK